MGQGFDVHRLVPGRPLVLGGVEVPHDRGLEGHSDADVLAHAVGDALLGAAGAGDLGTHFPSSETRWKDAAGEDLIARILEHVERADLEIENVDATLIAEEPRLGPFVGAIRKNLARILRVPEASVSVKVKSPDGLGAIGRGEGIAASAVVLLGRRS